MPWAASEQLSAVRSQPALVVLADPVGARVDEEEAGALAVGEAGGVEAGAVG